jgi:hypothetical protein
MRPYQLLMRPYQLPSLNLNIYNTIYLVRLRVNAAQLNPWARAVSLLLYAIPISTRIASVSMHCPEGDLGFHIAAMVA